MPVRKVKGGYRYGSTGKIYPTKAQAARQGRAIKASQAKAKTAKKSTKAKKKKSKAKKKTPTAVLGVRG